MITQITLDQITYDDIVYILSKPITLKVMSRNDFTMMTYKELELCGYGDNHDNALKMFSENFKNSYDYYMKDEYFLTSPKLKNMFKNIVLKEIDNGSS